jgi:hypothetical protein
MMPELQSFYAQSASAHMHDSNVQAPPAMSEHSLLEAWC